MDKSFTLVEIIMVIVIIGIIVLLAMPKFINLRTQACNATNEGTISALRSAANIYYAKSAIYTCLCLASTTPGSCNEYGREEDVEAPCYPANIEELEAQLASPPVWCGDVEGILYDSTTGEILPQ